MTRIRSAPAPERAAPRKGKRPEAAQQAATILSSHINFEKHQSETDGQYVDPVKWGDS